MKYIIDRIENNIAILENINTKEISEVNINILPNNIKEGTALKYINNKYIIDKELENERKKTILEKFNRLREPEQI